MEINKVLFYLFFLFLMIYILNYIYKMEKEDRIIEQFISEQNNIDPNYKLSIEIPMFLNSININSNKSTRFYKMCLKLINYFKEKQIQIIREDTKQDLTIDIIIQSFQDYSNNIFNIYIHLDIFTQEDQNLYKQIINMMSGSTTEQPSKTTPSPTAKTTPPPPAKTTPSPTAKTTPSPTAKTTTNPIDLICVDKNDKKCKITLDKDYKNTGTDLDEFKRACVSRNGKYVDKNLPPYKDIDITDWGDCIDNYSPFMLNRGENNQKYLEHKALVESIKKDNLKQFLTILKNVSMPLDEELIYGYDGNLLLHEAIYQKANNILNILLDKVCSKSLNKHNKDGNSVLNLATLTQLDWVVDRLLKTNPGCFKIKDTNLKGHTPFLSAIWVGSETLFNLFLQKVDRGLLMKTDINPLYISISTPNKNMNIIKTLIKLGFDFVNNNLADSKENNDTIIQTLQKQPKTPLNLEIETLLIKTFHDFYTNNDTVELNEYKSRLKDHKEYAPYTFEHRHNCSNIEYIQPDISYNYKYKDEDRNLEGNPFTDLYRDYNQKPLKILPSSLEDAFKPITTTTQQPTFF